MGTQATGLSSVMDAANPLPLMFEPGEIAPFDMGTPQGADLADDDKQVEPSPYGEHNEKLPKALQLALQLLLTTFVNEGQRGRRDEIKRCRLAREFWKGLQYQYWTEGEGWHLPWEGGGGAGDGDEEPRFAFVTNFYQAFGLSIIAVLSQDVAQVKLWPQNAEDDKDVQTAEAGSDVIELVERNNDVIQLQHDEAFYLWTDGKVGAYVRYVSDAQRFGWREVNEMGSKQVPVGGDTYDCPECQTQTPASGFMGACQGCAAPLDQSHYAPPEMADVPVVQQTVKVPDGQEVIDIVGALELQTPPYANKQHQFGYLVWNQLAHRSLLKATFPWVAKKIGGGSITSDDSNAQYERTAMISLTQGGDAEPVGSTGDFTANLLILRQGWLRPWSFYQLEDDRVIQQLLKLYPDGCKVVFAGDVYCASYNESMDDHWRVMHALPGDGQNRPALGTSFISVQQRYNTLSNLTMETIEHGIPATFAVPGVVDFDAIRESYVEPGSMYPAAAAPGQRLGDSFFETQPTKVAPEVMPYMEQLGGQIGQFLTGAFPALFGGEMNDNKTASGYGMARDQALGRIGLVWRKMKRFHADIMLLSVDVFRKNRPDDVAFTVWGSGKAKTKWIEQARLRGSAVAYPATDSQYPEVPAQKRAVLQMLIASQDPLIMKFLSSPENLSAIRRIVGLEDLEIPDEQSRNKQHTEIDELLQMGAQGIEPTVAAEPDPMTGQLVPGPPQPGVPIDELLDDHSVEFEVIEVWSRSDAGMEAKQSNPMGFAQVKAHALAHFNALKAQQPPAMPAMAGPGAGAPPPPAGGK